MKGAMRLDQRCLHPTEGHDLLVTLNREKFSYERESSIPRDAGHCCNRTGTGGGIIINTQKDEKSHVQAPRLHFSPASILYS